MKREQIKKALECCAYGDCRNCTEYSNDSCGEKVLGGALELINSQEQRIKELSEENERILTALANYDRQTDVRIAENYYTVEAYEELREENERLREDCIKGANALIEEMQKNRTIKADTVRKMHSEIKERCIKGGIYPAFVESTIAEIAKEMMEGANEN